MYKAIDIYLEKRKTRQYVGRLQQDKKRFVFQYDEAYLKTGHPIPLGPDIPLNNKKYIALELFPSFADRIPSKQNPAYEEYCRSVGISASETNLLVLLTTLGKKGPSSFICVPVIEEEVFSSEQLKQFRKDLKLSIREFSDLFDVSSATVYRIENNKTSGKDALKRIGVYFNSPLTALDKIKVTGVKINKDKRDFAESFFKSQIRKDNLAVGPFTVTTDDIKRCSPEQIVELIKRLSLFECDQYDIPQNSVHFSENILAKDGGQDGVVKWPQDPSYTNYFPSHYNCFQIKKGPVTPSECKKEVCDKKGNLKPVIQNVIKNKGAYILCSTHPVSGVHLKAREEAIQEEIRKKGYDPDLIKIKFYDANMISDWLNHFPPLAIWFLKTVCHRNIGPWISWQEWSRDRDYRSEFMYHPDLENKKNNIYKILSEPRKVAHLVGVSGVGKTRLTLEVFRPTEKFDLSPFALYSSAEDITDFHLRELKKFRAILIIDDCPLEKAEIFHKIALQEDSQLSILTIGHEKQIISKDVNVIELSPDEEIVKKILSDSQDITNKYVDSKWLRLTSGFPLMAKLLKDLGPLDLLKDEISTIRKKMLWGMDRPDAEKEKVIKVCSLFDTICLLDDKWKQKGWIIYSTSINREKEEVKYIAERICKMNYDQFYAKVQYFKKKKIIQQYGKFIQVRPKPLAVWLAAEWIQETPSESVMKWLTDMSVYQEASGKHSSKDHEYNKLSDTEKKGFKKQRANPYILKGLQESFCKQFCHLNLSAENQELGQLLCGKEGFFGKEKVLTTYWGSTCFSYLAEAIPETALKTLKRVFESKTVEELSHLRGPRNNLVQTLQKLAVRKELYPSSARLLLKFAEAENEYYNGQPISNNSTGIFTHHFQILLSGTEAEPDMKFKIIDEIEQSGSITQKEIAVKALKKALPKKNYTGLFDSVMQTAKGKLFQNWQLKTYEESWNYFRKALTYLVKFATKDENKKVQDSAQKVIAQNLSSLIEIENLHNDVYKAVQSVISVHGTYWPEAIRNLRWFIKYKSKKTIKENIEKANEMLKILQPKKEDINKRLKLYVKEDSDLYEWEESTGKKTKYNKNFETLIKDFKNYLEKEDESKITPIIYPLLHGKRGNTIPFAREIVQKLKNPLEVTSLLLDLIKKWKKHTDFNPSFLSGFLAGLNKNNPDTVQKILDNISNDNHLADLILPAYWSLSLKDQDIKRLIAVINNKSVKINANELKWLFTGQKCESVSTKIIGQLMTLLIEKSVEYSWSALHIYSYYIDSKSEKKEALLHILYKLLTRRKLLTQDKKRYDTMNGHFYKKAVSDVLDSTYGKRFSEIFTSEVLSSKLSLFEFPIDDYYIKKCFKKVMEKYPDIVLSEVMNCDLNNVYVQDIFESIFGGNNSLGGGEGIFNTNSSCTLDEQKIKKWCEKAPDKIPAFLARNKNLFSYDEEKKKWSWSSFALFLFDKYGDREDVTRAITMNLRSFQWTGDILKYFEQIKTTVKELQKHKHKNVRDFCEKELKFLEEKIKREKQIQKEREEFGVW
ncbi:MAG: HipA N-terminal domain-containing protein [Bdellovibrionales bacterium]|nr:HipA N-terminal domain-containing protein [Bdellovibrionales bacterium]